MIVDEEKTLLLREDADSQLSQHDLVTKLSKLITDNYQTSTINIVDIESKQDIEVTISIPKVRF